MAALACILGLKLFRLDFNYVIRQASGSWIGEGGEEQAQSPAFPASKDCLQTSSKQWPS